MRDLTRYPIKREEVVVFLRGVAITLRLEDAGIGGVGPYILDRLQRFAQAASDDMLAGIFGVGPIDPPRSG